MGSAQADNTPREHKNQQLLIWSSWLIASRRLRSVDTQFFIVGHTHNICDQRFSVIAPILASAHVLQSPDEFLDRIAAKVKPTGGRDLHVEKLDVVYDWTEFFEPLGINISGLVSTHDSPVTNHSWRLVRRGDLEMYRKDPGQCWDVQIPQVPQGRKEERAERVGGVKK